MEGIQTKGKDRRTVYIYEYGVEVNTIGLHFVLFVVGLPQFRGRQSFSFGAGGNAPLCPSLATGLDVVGVVGWLLRSRMCCSKAAGRIKLSLGIGVGNKAPGLRNPLGHNPVLRCRTWVG